MPDFNDLDSLLKYVQKQHVADALNNEVAEAVKTTESEVIDGVVYYYSPKDYVRRYDRGGGGLNDPRNMVSEVSQDGSTLSVENITHGDNDYNVNVAGLVEYGQQNTQGYGHYDWTPPRDREPLYLDPRDYMGETVRRLEESGDVKKALIEGLTRNGLTVE